MKYIVTWITITITGFSSIKKENMRVEFKDRNIAFKIYDFEKRQTWTTADFRIGKSYIDSVKIDSLTDNIILDSSK